MQPRVLNELVYVISETLVSLFENLWRLGEVPNWKSVNTLFYTIPIFKKGKVQGLGNYREVCLTLIPGKIIDKASRNLL